MEICLDRVAFLRGQVESSVLKWVKGPSWPQTVYETIPRYCVREKFQLFLVLSAENTWEESSVAVVAAGSPVSSQQRLARQCVRWPRPRQQTRLMPVVLAPHQAAKRMKELWKELIWGKLFLSKISVERKYFSNWANTNFKPGAEDTTINSFLLSLRTTAPESKNNWLICNGLTLKPNDGS